MSTSEFHRFVQTSAGRGLHQAAMLARRTREQAAMAEAWRGRMRLFALQRQMVEAGLPLSPRKMLEEMRLRGHVRGPA